MTDGEESLPADIKYQVSLIKALEFLLDFLVSKTLKQMQDPLPHLTVADKYVLHLQ